MSYRTLFLATVRQDSALSIGGNEPHRTVDQPLCKNGNGEWTIRGAALAGALVATLRKLYKYVPRQISAGVPKMRDSPDPPESVWTTYTAHPRGRPTVAIRPGVSIREDTLARLTGALFDLETLDRGTEWPFLLEVDTSASHGSLWEGYAARALLEWASGRCWLGGSAARGLGWAHLENLRAVRLPAEMKDEWPSSESCPFELAEQLEADPIQADEFREQLTLPRPDKPWYYGDYEGTIRVGYQAGDYGADFLAVGGQQTLLSRVPRVEGHIVEPDSVEPLSWLQSDRLVAFRELGAAQFEPYLPGSSLRGALRAHLRRRLRETSRDPSHAEELFGSLEQTSRLLVRDAYVEPERWKVAKLEQRAADEFTQGPFESAKFDGLVVVEGTFKWRLVIEAEEKADLERWAFLIDELLEDAARKRIPLGREKFAGLGWVSWTTGAVSLASADEEDRGQPNQACQPLAEEEEREDQQRESDRELGNERENPTPTLAEPVRKEPERVWVRRSSESWEDRLESVLEKRFNELTSDGFSCTCAWEPSPVLSDVDFEDWKAVPPISTEPPTGLRLEEARLVWERGVETLLAVGDVTVGVRFEEVAEEAESELAQRAESFVLLRQDSNRFGIDPMPANWARLVEYSVARGLRAWGLQLVNGGGD